MGAVTAFHDFRVSRFSLRLGLTRDRAKSHARGASRLKAIAFDLVHPLL
jgi:hypothetical protein